MRKINDNSLYLVISEEYAKGKSALEIARLAISGGVDIIQMREKRKPEEDLIRLGAALGRLCKENNVTFIINDDPALAKKLDADGVHLGEEDMKKYPLKEVRHIIGEDKIIGMSTHSLEQFKKANAEDINYIAFGPIFKTKTKDFFLGTGDIENVMAIAAKPVFFIGGITLSNVDEVLKKRAKNIALIRGITEADDIVAMTRNFKERLKGA